MTHLKIINYRKRISGFDFLYICTNALYWLSLQRMREDVSKVPDAVTALEKKRGGDHG